MNRLVWLSAFDTVPANVPVAMKIVNPAENTEVIPMQETLEVRLKESSFPVNNEWIDIVSTGHSKSCNQFITASRSNE